MKTRDKILQAALDLFVANGIDKTSTAKICAAVGLSSGGMFVHFPTKQNLIEELYLNRKKCSMEDFKKVINPKASVEQNIRAVSEQLLRYYARQEQDFLYIRMVQNSPQISERVLNVMKAEYAEQAKAMQYWIDAGVIKNLDPELLQQVWWSVLIPFIEKMHREKLTKPKPEWIDFVWEALKK